MNNPTMDLRHLRSFLALAEERHFGRAARRLHIVQPALSMQVKALEEELGGPLFVRTTRRVELTDAGRLLQVEATRTLEQADHAERAVRRALRGETGRVRVGFAGAAVLSGELVSLVRSFRQTYPDADFSLHELSPQEQVDAIYRGDLDVAYVAGYGRVLDDRLVSVPAGEWRTMVALPSNHELASRPGLSLRDIAKQPLVVYAAQEQPILRTLHRALGPARGVRVAHRASSTLGMLGLVGAGLGLGLVPEALSRVGLPELRFVPLREAALRVELLSRADETARAVQAFVAAARKHFRSEARRSSRSGDAGE